MSTKLVTSESLREYEEKFLKKIPTINRDYFTVTSLAEFLGCDITTVNRIVLWEHGVPHHVVGARKIIKHQDLRKWLVSAEGVEWVHDRITRGRMKQRTWQKIKEFMYAA